MKKYLGLFIGLVLLVPVTAFGAEFRAGDKTLNATETIQDNLYMAGGNLNLMGTVDGDLIVAGGTINILGTVTGDVLAAGGTINISGQVGEDVRAAGGTIMINGQVGGEVVLTGGNLSVVSGASIAKNAYLIGGRATVDGSIGKNLEIRSSEIIMGPTARVVGDFDYYSEKELGTVNGATINGKTTFHLEQIKKTTYPTHKFPWLAFLTFWWLVKITGTVILAWLIFYLWPTETKSMITTALSSPGRELIRGFVLFFIIPIAVIICSITLIGLPLAAIGGFFFASLTVFTVAVSGLLVAALITRFIFKKKEAELNWWIILLGILVLAIIKLIPLVGWIIGFLIYLTAFGILTNKIYKKLLPEK